MDLQQQVFPNWMRGFLLAAVAYNVLWGIFIGWFPSSFYGWVLETKATAPDIIIWQGRAVLLMAVIYFLGALHPGKFWFFMLFGAFTKIAGGIWFYIVILEQQVGDKALFHLLMNDLIWVPFLIWIAIKGKAYKSYKNGTKVS